MNPYKRLWILQTKELSTRSFSCSSTFAGSFTRFVVRSFSPASARWTFWSLTRSFAYLVARSDVRSLGFPFVRSFALRVCSVFPPLVWRTSKTEKQKEQLSTRKSYISRQLMLNIIITSQRFLATKIRLRHPLEIPGNLPGISTGRQITRSIPM